MPFYDLVFGDIVLLPTSTVIDSIYATDVALLSDNARAVQHSFDGLAIEVTG